MVGEFEEITQTLSELELNYKSKTVFISGAAHEYNGIEEREALKFVYKLSGAIATTGARIVSGFGLGIGSSVISSVLEQTYTQSGAKVADQLVLRPFPQTTEGEIPLAELWTSYRRDMIRHAGIAVFLFGNKLRDGEVVLSQGMREEYEIAKEQGLFLIPIGSTGYMAEQLWEEVNEQVQANQSFSKEIKDLYKLIGTSEDLDEIVIDAVVTIVNTLGGK